MNRFWTGQGPCRANLQKRGLTQSPSYDCGQRQTVNHIVDTCPSTKLEGGLNLLHEANDVAVTWLWNLQRLQHSLNNNRVASKATFQSWSHDRLNRGHILWRTPCSEWENKNKMLLWPNTEPGPQ